MILDDIKVELLDYMGSDKTVVDAARASFDKQARGSFSNELTPKDISLIKFLARGYTQEDWDGMAKRLQVATDLDHIKYMMWQLRTGATHFAPFCHPQISIRMKAPLAIARQLWKSHVGAVGGDTGYAAWSEGSRRYIDREPEFFLPQNMRKRASNVKQGSSNEIAAGFEVTRLQMTYERTGLDYIRAINSGVAPEQARFGLPTGMMVTWVWTGSLMFWARLCLLRLDVHAQKESQDAAKLIGDIVAPLFPYSWEALLTGDTEIHPGLADRIKIGLNRLWWFGWR